MAQARVVAPREWATARAQARLVMALVLDFSREMPGSVAYL